jgi:hypothetical protein
MKKQKTIIYNPESPDSRYRWIEHASKGLRIVGTCNDILPRLRHTGWYLDSFQDKTVHGAVIQLPARDGEPQYIPAIADPWNDDSYFADFHSLYTDKEEAARDADGMAERYAETERDYQIRESASLAIEDARADICNCRATLHRLAFDLRTAGHALPPSTRETVRLRIADLRASAHRAVETIRQLAANPYALEG